MTEVFDAIELAKLVASNHWGLVINALIARPILPRDINRVSWLWDKSEEKITAPDGIFLLITGV